MAKEFSYPQWGNQYFQEPAAKRLRLDQSCYEYATGSQSTVSTRESIDDSMKPTTNVTEHSSMQYDGDWSGNFQDLQNNAVSLPEDISSSFDNFPNTSSGYLDQLSGFSGELRTTRFIPDQIGGNDSEQSTPDHHHDTSGTHQAVRDVSKSLSCDNCICFGMVRAS